MALDASIYNALGRGVKSVGEYDQEAQASQLNALALQQGRMKQDEYTRGLADQETLRATTRGFGADATANYNALLRTGNLQAAQGYRKQLDDQALTQAKTKQENTQTAGYAQDQAIKSTQLHLQDLSMVGDPQQFAQWAQAGVQNGVFTPEQYQRGMQALQGVTNPQQFAELKQKALMGGASALEQLKLKADAEQQAERMRQFGVTSAETARSHRASEGLTAQGQAVTMRGQNMADARARESTAATMTKPFEVTGPDGVPMLVQQDRQGNLAPVAGFGPKAGASKPLNDSQAKALLFGSRMQESDKLLNEMSAKGVDRPSTAKQIAEHIPLVGGALGAVANFQASPDQQSVEQAQRDFVNAVLRRESGAAIAESEFANAQKQYFPSIGDSAQVKAQKAANRQLAIKGLLAEVPAGQRGAITSQTAGATASAHPPEIADLLNKYGAK